MREQTQILRVNFSIEISGTFGSVARCGGDLMPLEQLTPEVVQLISAVLSFASVLVAAIAAPFVFSAITAKSVGNFDTAVKKVTDSASAVEQKISQLELSFDRLQDRLTVIDQHMSEQFSSLQINQGRTQGRIDDEAAIAELELPASGVDVKDPTARERLIESWNQIRDLLEEAAADPEIDGRTRAKYARIDRRNYSHLADALSDDGYLPGNAHTWEKAISLWYESRKHLRGDLGDRPSQMQEYWETLRTASEGSRVHYDLSWPEEIRKRACAGEFGLHLTYEVLAKHFPDYSEASLRQVLPNFSEGGPKVLNGAPPCFRRVARGRYVAICD